MDEMTADMLLEALAGAPVAPPPTEAELQQMADEWVRRQTERHDEQLRIIDEYHKALAEPTPKAPF